MTMTMTQPSRSRGSWTAPPLEPLSRTEIRVPPYLADQPPLPIIADRRAPLTIREKRITLIV